MPLKRHGGGEAWLTGAVLLLALAPVVVALIEALADGYAPNGDRAVVAIRAHDVLTAHPPLVGAYSTTSVLTGVDTYSPGPLLYWLLALPGRLPGFWALPTTIALLNAACVVGIVLLARRRGGPLFMVVAAASLLVMWSSLPTDLANDIWAPSAPVLPLALLVIVGWSVACGDAFLLPVAVLLASFVAQCHLAYVLPAILILVIGCVGLLATIRMGHAPASRYPVRRWAVLAGLVALVCWTLPLVDEVLSWAGKEGHGNLTHIAKAVHARGVTAGFDAGLHALVRMIGVRPWWLRPLPAPADRTFEIFSPVSALAVATTVGWLAALVWASVVGWRRRRVDVVVACAIGASLCLSMVAFTAGFPNSEGLIFSYSYGSWWGQPAGMWVWMLVGWSTATLVKSSRPLLAPARAIWALTAAACVLAVALLGFRARGHLVDPDEYKPSGRLIAQVRANAPSRGPILITGHSFGFDASTTYALRLEGLGVGSPDARELGTSYAIPARDFAEVIEITESDRRPPPMSKLIGRVTLPSSPPRTVSVILKP